MSTASAMPTTFWIHHTDEVQQMTANEVLGALEHGTINLETSYSLNADGQTKPLRRIIRELVWMSFMNANHVMDKSLNNESPFRVAFEKSHAGMAIADLSGRIQFVNTAFAELLGRDADSMRGLLVGEFSHAEDHDLEVQLGNELFAGTRSGFQLKKRFKHADGSWIPTLMNLGLARGADSEPQMVVASIVDIREWMANEERKSIEAELDAIQKIARGVAHDYNNLLTVIDHSVYFLQHDTRFPSEDVDAIANSSKIAKRLNRQLETLGTITAEKTQIDIAHELRQQKPLLEHLIAIGQTLYLEVPDTPIVVTIDHSSLEQVLLNLVVNATQAIDGQGTITVRLHEASDEIVLSVQDTGVGIPPEMLATVFEPFVSTKESGRGLGLSIVKTAIMRCGCTIDVQSTLNEGTEIRIHIPIELKVSN